MLTIRENFMETIKGGRPDRFVKQYEYQEWLNDPLFPVYFGSMEHGQFTNGFGVINIWPEGEPGPFPLTDPAHVVVSDITKWKEQCKAPNMVLGEDAWKECIEQANAIDRKEKFVTAKVFCGMFEKLHYLMGMENTMCNFYDEPEAMHDLIDYLTEFELEIARETIKYTHPDLLFHHDDWGSQKSLFISRDMFDEFLLEPYKKIYGFWKANGVEIIVHHTDCYSADLAPEMLEMGIDVFQGAIDTNNIPQLIKEYGPKGLSVQGGLNNGKYDHEGWTDDEVRKGLGDLLASCGPLYLIPALTMGGPETTYPGLYERVDELIGEFDSQYFPLR